MTDLCGKFGCRSFVPQCGMISSKTLFWLFSYLPFQKSRIFLVEWKAPSLSDLSYLFLVCFVFEH